MEIKFNGNTDNLYYIGGVVRDELLGKENFDIDLTYVGDAIEFAKSLKNVQILKINEPFGTVRVLTDGREVDIASTRAEIYENAGHLPIITKIGCNLKEDVLRRDFTINALAKNYNTGEIIDYAGGLKDIKNKKLRVLHDKSFVDDPTRILRALKFSVRFDFDLEDRTKYLRDEYLKNINYDMSYKRLKKELIETFNLNSQTAYEKFINSNIYKLVTQETFSLPKINIENIINKYKSEISPDNIWLIYLGTLPDLSNLLPSFTKEEKKIIEDFYQIKDKILNNEFEIFDTFRNINPESIILYAVMNNIQPVHLYFNRLKNIQLSITGQDIQNLGIKPSKKYKECFDFILKEKIKNPTLKHIDEIQIAENFFNQ